MIAAEVMIPCASPVASCRLDWAAIAAIGGWVAAIVTFLAVILPMKRRKSEDRAVAKAAMVDFAEVLIALRDSMGIAGFLVNSVKPGGDASKKNSLVRGLSRQVSVPTLAATPEMLPLVQALNRLRRAVIRWNETVATFDVSYDPELGGAFEDHLIDGLKRDHDRLMDEIRAVARMIRPMVKGFEQDLDLIITSGNGFLPIPRPPDEL
ncbi:hypothetical protein [uncultured Stenotrophomonas sp.]|uniref:hypothetical protein n=1 Tax=uncultured Stenotrophomonas sp. TaxID=165438 RepID=UPI0028D7417A|nr:hypothetical protein [uncultured Stenotrophomonas sp.]